MNIDLWQQELVLQSSHSIWNFNTGCCFESVIYIFYVMHVYSFHVFTHSSWEIYTVIQNMTKCKWILCSILLTSSPIVWDNWISISFLDISAAYQHLFAWIKAAAWIQTVQTCLSGWAPDREHYLHLWRETSKNISRKFKTLLQGSSDLTLFVYHASIEGLKKKNYLKINVPNNYCAFLLFTFLYLKIVYLKKNKNFTHQERKKKPLMHNWISEWIHDFWFVGFCVRV